MASYPGLPKEPGPTNFDELVIFYEQLILEGRLVKKQAVSTFLNGMSMYFAQFVNSKAPLHQVVFRHYKKVSLFPKVYIGNLVGFKLVTSFFFLCFMYYNGVF